MIDHIVSNPQVATQDAPGQSGHGVKMSEDGNRAIVGFVGRQNISAGQIVVADRGPGGFNTTLTIVNPFQSLSPKQDFGRGLDINADGTIIVVGAPSFSGSPVFAGTAYVFEDLTGSPITTTELTRPNPTSFSNFGEDVVISGDGRTIVVGARQASDDGFVFGNVFVYEKQGSPGVWTNVFTISNPDAADQNFGISVAVDRIGDKIVIGDQDSGGVGVGKAYVYTRVGSPMFGSPISWVVEGELLVGLPSIAGQQVVISKDGTVAALAAPGDDFGSPEILGAGAVYVYRRGSPTTWGLEKRIHADNAHAAQLLGSSLEMSDSGLSIIVGASSEGVNLGSVYVFQHDGSPIWQQTIEIKGTTSGSPATGAGNFFGSAVDLSGDAKTLIVGVPRFSDVETRTGAAFIYDTTTITGEDVFLGDSFQHFILEADSTNNTFTVEGDVRNLLVDFSGPPIPATVQHSVVPGSPIVLNNNNGPVVISRITYDHTTDSSLIFVDTVTDDFPTGWIIYNP